MTDDLRETIRELDKRRLQKRSKLAGDTRQAKHDLHPRTLFGRWKSRKTDQLGLIADSGKQELKKNAPLIGLAGAAILLFSVRKPISRLYQHLRNKAQQAKDRSS
jgi:hypothetical protein